MALSHYFYIEGNPPFIHHQGKCWRRLTDQSLAGTTLVPGIDDVILHTTANECLGITDLHEIAELEAIVKVSPDGEAISDPTSELDMDIFQIHDLSFLARAQQPELTITLDSILALAGTPYFSFADISMSVNFDQHSISNSYNVYADNGLDPVTDPPNFIPRSVAWLTTIQPDVLSFHDGLPA
tara:strand:- start:1261 stop:1809 length:549 start_codon:yes stop_codon:yes gene_type:complete